MDEYLDSAIAFVRASPLAAGAIGLVLLYLLVRKTKLLLFLLLLAAVLGGVFFVIGEMSGKGTAQKREMIHRTDLKDVK